MLLFVGLPSAIQTSKTTKEVVEIEFHPAIIAKSSIPTRQSRDSSVARSKSRSMGKAVSLKGMNLFGQRYSYDLAAKNESEIGQGSGLGDYKDSATYALGSDSFLGENDQWEFYRQVFERIDSQLLFDSILAQYSHFGSVFVEFEVDAQGRFVQSKIKVSAEDSILKVHALRALTKGLKESFRKEKWNPTGKNSILHAKFDYVFGDSDLNFKKQREFGKPIFLFRRATAEKPIPNDLKEHLLNGGIGYDAFAVAERWQKYNKKKKLRQQEFDPFATYKNDPLYSL